MTNSDAESPARADGPAVGVPRRVGIWPWIFGLIFVSLSLSSFYFASLPVPLARRMDAARSSLARDGRNAVRARILVLGVPDDGQVRAVPRAPGGPGERWRVDVAWTAEPAARVATAGGERLFDVRIEAEITELEVWDRRGGLAPERMLLSLPPDEAR